MERNLVINNRELTYKGIFEVDKFFEVINQALVEKDYIKEEKRTEELVQEGGRKTFVELRPRKQKSTFMTLMIKLRITLDNLMELVADVHGEKKKVQQGSVHIAFDSWLLSDYEFRWGMKPWAYFLKGLINKYVYTFPLEAGYPGELSGDTAFIYAKIKTFLNSYRDDQEKARISEREVMDYASKDIEAAEKEEISS